jgi:hypothetical protein
MRINLSRNERSDLRFAKFTITELKTSNLKRHEATPFHIKAVNTFLNISTDMVGAPSTHDFLAVWSALRSGNLCKKGIEGIAAYKKAREMLWCIHEAITIPHQCVIALAASI